MVFFHLLQLGKDYTLNFITGRLEFLIHLNKDVCIYVRYTRDNQNLITSDPSARIVDNKIETFIYCGQSLNEDINRDGSPDIEVIPDGKINYDIYEVRGVYNIGISNIQERDFFFEIINQNDEILINATQDLSPYEINYKTGILTFGLREPFKNIRGSDKESYVGSSIVLQQIYSENPLNAVEQSLFSIRLRVNFEIQNYKLKRNHIIENSMEVFVDGIVVDPSLYHVDHYLGFLYFRDKHNLLIKSNSKIKVTYEYSNFGQNQAGYLVGLRSEYNISKDMQIGNTLLYSGQFEGSEPPHITSTPSSRFLVQGDLNMELNEHRLTKFINSIPTVDVDLVPIQYRLSAEYSHSFVNLNTFGRAIVDDMESSEESIFISTSERDWIISSPPEGLNPCDRSPLLYRYYRDPQNLVQGPVPLQVQPIASPSYQTTAGPYNVAEGHLNQSQLQESDKQNSLVLDVDFSKGGLEAGKPYASIVTRNFGLKQGRDLSYIEYIEFAARLIDSENLTSGIRLQFDFGIVNEDSDQDQQLDTEDVGLDGKNNDLNGDNIPDQGVSFTDGEKNEKIDFFQDGNNEDIGYIFNAPTSCPSLQTKIGAGPNISGYANTRGNGVLNTEDLNRDGFLSTIEDTISFGTSSPYTRIDSDNNLNHQSTVLPGDWQLVRIYLDYSKLSAHQQQILKGVRSIRLTIQPSNSVDKQGKGKLLIDHIKLGSSLWRYKKASSSSSGTEVTLTNNNVLEVATIDNFGSRKEYFEDSFIRRKQDDYEFLHGVQTSTERGPY